MGKLQRKFPSNGKKPKEISTKDSKFSKKDHKTNRKSHVLKLPKTSTGIRKIISKKEKQKVKHQKTRAKIELTKEAFKEDKARKKRQKTAVVGDLKPLLNSLPSLDELVKPRDKSIKTGISSIDRRISNAPKNKHERRQHQLNEKTATMLDRFDNVQKIWRDPEFKKNPRKLIAEKLRRKQSANEMN